MRHSLAHMAHGYAVIVISKAVGGRVHLLLYRTTLVLILYCTAAGAAYGSTRTVRYSTNKSTQDTSTHDKYTSTIKYGNNIKMSAAGCRLASAIAATRMSVAPPSPPPERPAATGCKTRGQASTRDPAGGDRDLERCLVLCTPLRPLPDAQPLLPSLGRNTVRELPKLRAFM